MGAPIVPGKPKVRHTKVMQFVESPGMPPQVAGIPFPFSKSGAIKRLKRTVPLPNEFWCDLNRNGTAEYIRSDGVKVTMELVEFDPSEEKQEIVANGVEPAGD